MVLSKSKGVSYILFWAMILLTALDVFVFIMERKVSSWLLTHILLYFVVGAVSWVGYRFVSDKACKTIIGIIFMGIAVFLTAADPLSQLFPAVMIPIGFFIVVQAHSLQKKYWIYLVYIIISLCLCIAISILQEGYYLTFIKTFIVFMGGGFIIGVLMDDKFYSILLKTISREEDETEKT